LGRPGQAPRVHSVDEPTPTIRATGRIQLAVAEPVTAGQTYDIRFRMLEPKELARAMGFSDAETGYEFAGNKTEITKQIGNAVRGHGDRA
jgi:DNA (cytosine-5)-methyltransferase 1